jgi:hypothetical protein
MEMTELIVARENVAQAPAVAGAAAALITEVQGRTAHRAHADHHDQPHRYQYLENALMSREMDRL